MKKILLLLIPLSILLLQNCSNNFNDEYESILQSESRIQKELIGNWKFWGRFSIERNNWIAAAPDQLYKYEFKSDGAYSYIDQSSEQFLTGDYKVIPATDKANPYILLNCKSVPESSSKKLLIVFLDNKFISIFEHPNEDRYQKQ